MNKVMRLTAIPPMMGMAIGCITSLPRPVDQKIGRRPNTAVAVVIRHGRMRLSPASNTASRMNERGRRQRRNGWGTAAPSQPQAKLHSRAPREGGHPCQGRQKMERVEGFEPSTLTLAT